MAQGHDAGCSFIRASDGTSSLRSDLGAVDGASSEPAPRRRALTIRNLGNRFRIGEAFANLLGPVRAIASHTLPGLQCRISIA